jgi:hypothetical protein
MSGCAIFEIDLLSAGIRGVHKLFAITAKPPFTIPRYRSAPVHAACRRRDVAL